MIRNVDGPGTAELRVEEKLERFDLEDQGGRLIDAEHRGRYWWAAQIAAGKDVLDVACGTGYGSEILSEAGAASVTGVDVSKDAVAAASRRLGERATVRSGDIRELPLDDDSFDLIVCWETIEHIEDGQRAIAELRRVLRPEGTLLVSSPNPRVYPPGNEFHVHEYTPKELATLVSEHFSTVASFRQHAWLASAIEAAEQRHTRESDSWVKKTAPLSSGEETYGLIAASDAALPELSELIVLGHDFEVRWWKEQLTETQRLLALAENDRTKASRQAHDASAALLEANQALARMPALEFRLREAEEAHVALRSMERSISWRITAPLRRLRAILAGR